MHKNFYIYALFDFKFQRVIIVSRIIQNIYDTKVCNQKPGKKAAS